jgi:carboxylate-amine ligase
VTSRTVGVEEEFILVDALTSRPVPLGPALVVDAGDPCIRTEFKQEQVEITSRPCRTMDELTADLVELRRRVGELAQRRDVVLVASGTWPGVHEPTAGESARFSRIDHEFGQLARQQLTCGTHVHVAVDSPEEGVLVLDRIRPWLSVLTALSANSPFWQGRDTGCASFRSVVLSQLPTAGPTDVWGDLDTYRRVAGQVIDVGGAFDEGMLYYDARLSARYPTVEVRVTDVNPDPGVAVAVAALCRALVASAVEGRLPPGAAANGTGSSTTPPAISTLALRAAAWRAARHGLTERLLDPATAELVPASHAVESLLTVTGDALEEEGDLERVRAGVDRLVGEGGTAERQRRLINPSAVGIDLTAFRIA